MIRKPIQIKPKPVRVQSGWRVIDGRRIYFRSRWEYLYALFLQWQKDQRLILDWEHEPETFWFESIKRGVRSYMPDFLVYLPSGERYWVEVKGYMDKKSITKISRFKKFYPSLTLIVVGKEWFERRLIKAPE